MEHATVEHSNQRCIASDKDSGFYGLGFYGLGLSESDESSGG